MLHLVRHAKAGKRDHWDGPDEARPLTASGRRQAEGIADRLAKEIGPGARILASPYVRCVQTVEPLAERLGTTVVPADALAEGSAFLPVLELLASLPDGSVLCSHGDLIPDVVQALVRRGAVVDGPPDWRKGATWELARGDDGQVQRVRAVAPPES